jgi:hypothetical protein
MHRLPDVRVLFCAAGRQNLCSSSTTVTVPYITEDKSDIRGIKPGWDAMEDDGDLSLGPFSSHEECLREISQATNYSPQKILRSPPD